MGSVYVAHTRVVVAGFREVTLSRNVNQVRRTMQI